eukprot:9116146-Heterocapsa_arctica.AAC.1
MSLSQQFMTEEILPNRPLSAYLNHISAITTTMDNLAIRNFDLVLVCFCIDTWLTMFSSVATVSS